MDIRDYAKLYDIFSVLGVPPTKKAMLCPLPQHVHSNNTPSFSVKVFDDGHQRFRCFGNCGLGGDVIDLVGYMNIPFYDPENTNHISMALSILRDGYKISQPVKFETVRHIDQGLWQKYLPPGEAVIRYAASRGLNAKTVEKFKIGQNKNAMAIPVFERGALRAIKYRNMGRGLRYWSEEGSSKALFNYDAVAMTEKPVIVVKGEIPAMLLDQYGLAACCITGGESAGMEDWAHLFAFSAGVVVVGDNDRNPRTRKEMVAKAEERAKVLSADLRFPPLVYKDIDEWLLSEPEAIHEVRQWLGLEQEKETCVI